MAASGEVPPAPVGRPRPLEHPALFDTGVWAWVRDRRFPALAAWFDDAARRGQVLVCDLVVIELVRATSDARRARAVADRLRTFGSLPMPAELWSRAREVQLLMAASGDHRRVPPADLLIAATAELANLPLLHYDRDYERIAAVSGQSQRWFVPDGALA